MPRSNEWGIFVLVSKDDVWPKLQVQFPAIFQRAICLQPF
jgi:hypothetical protein